MKTNHLHGKSGYEIRMWIIFAAFRFEEEIHGYDVQTNTYSDGFVPQPERATHALMAKTVGVQYHALEVGSAIIEFWTHPAYDYVYICDRIGADHLSISVSKPAARKLWAFITSINNHTPFKG